MNEPAGVSLSAIGLRLAEGLECPEGGYHNVPEAAVAAALNTRRPTSCGCLKCRRVLTLEPAR